MVLHLDEARSRAALLSDVSAELHLDLTSTEDFGCTARLIFACAEPGRDSFVELSGGRDLAASLNGAALTSYDGERLALPDLAADNVLEVSARLPYVTDGNGMHTVTDPADGERYVCAFTAMDIARKVIPCFDQPDLKTVFTLTVTAPEHWSVVANGPLLGHEDGVWSFGATPPIPSYLFSLYAGPWHSFTWTESYDGREVDFGWHTRASLAAELDRDAAELRDITSRCFAHYTSVFDEPYAFADYQQVFAPGLNWGAMEFPGCVSFRDEYLFRGELTAMQRAGRASVIAHEMAHMWFGDLVTMRWWEDSWLNESFADFMGYEVSGRAAGFTDSWVAAALRRKPTAYQADRRRSTHPIAEDAESVPDADTAFANFDMITYAKGNAVLRQLVTWLGEDDFLAGVNAHLSRHPFDNASLEDFLDALDGATDRDVRAWAALWLRTTGFDTIRLTHDGDVPVLTREGTRPHRFTVTGYDGEWREVASRLVDLADEPVRLDDMAGLVVVPNSGDEAYAALALDEVTWSALHDGLGAIPDPLTRALVWSTAILQTELGGLSVDDLVGLTRHLREERHPVVFEGALVEVIALVRAYADPDALSGFLGTLSSVADEVRRVGDDRHAAAAQNLAAVCPDADLLRAWLPAEADQDVRWDVVHRLASLGDDSWIGPESERDRSTAGEQGALRARAAVPTLEAKTASWERLMSGELSVRDFEAIGAGFWGWGQHDLVEPWLTAYAREGLALGQRSGQAYADRIADCWPLLPLRPAQRRTLRDAVAAAVPDAPTVLARGWSDRLDDLDLVIATEP